MNQEVSSPRGYAVAGFLVDVDRRTVFLDGVLVPIQGKTFDVLDLLITHRDRVVTKDELLRGAWPDTFVQENNLARHVSTLRKTLGKTSDGSEFILTVQGRGYRFVGPVTALPDTVAPVPKPVDVVVPAVQATAAAHRPAGPSGWRRSLWWSAGAVATTLAAIATLGVLRLPAAGSAGPVLLRPLTYGPDTQTAPTWAPDRRSFAYTSERDGNVDIYVQTVDGGDPVRVTSNVAADWAPVWSPNGRWLAFRSERNGGGIFVASPEGRHERQVTTFGFDPLWAADSQRLLFHTSTIARTHPAAFIAGLDGQTRQVRPDIMTRFWQPSVAWHPDGRRISVAGMTRPGQWEFITATLDGTDAVTSTIPEAVTATTRALDLSLGAFVWAPSGRHLYFEGRSHDVTSVWRADIDPSTLAWQGTLSRLTAGSGHDRNLAVSQDGRTLAFETGTTRTRIWAFALDATGAAIANGEPITPGAAGEFDVAMSRDGQQLVYRTTRDDRQELWQLSLPDQRQHRLVTDLGTVRSVPRWSPDGARLSYLVSYVGSDRVPSRDPVLAVYSTAAGSEQLLTNPNSQTVTPDDWTSDGHSILGACRADKTSRTSLCLVPADGSGPATVLVSDPQRGLHSARFSPDQRWIVFIGESGSGTSTVYVRATGGGPLVPITDGRAFEDKTRWAPDGRSVYFVSTLGGQLNVWGRAFDPEHGTAIGNTFQVTHFAGPYRGIAPDLNKVDFAISAGRLFIPITETSAHLWALDGLLP